MGPCRLPRTVLALAPVLALMLLAPPVEARQWTDATGRFQINAELIAFSSSTVVLKRQDGDLIAVPIERLAEDDREFLKSKEAHQEIADDGQQTWTMRSGLMVSGRVVAYGRKAVTLQRRRNRIFVNDRQFENLPEVYQKMVPRIVGHFEGLEIESRADLQQWILRQMGQPRTFVCEGVMLALENGDEYAVPFFFFSDEDQKFLQPGWEQWLAAEEKHDERSQHDLYLEARAREYHLDREFNRQVKMMQLDLLAINAGIVDLWEVALFPQIGPGIWVVVPARNSLQASQAALAKFPGHRVGPVRRLN